MSHTAYTGMFIGQHPFCSDSLVITVDCKDQIDRIWTPLLITGKKRKTLINEHFAIPVYIVSE